jgi:hypothetical protein
VGWPAVRGEGVPRREGERAPREGGRREVECRDPFSGPRGGTRRRASMAAAWAAAAKAGIWSAAGYGALRRHRRLRPGEGLLLVLTGRHERARSAKLHVSRSREDRSKATWSGVVAEFSFFQWGVADRAAEYWRYLSICLPVGRRTAGLFSHLPVSR